MQLLALSGQYLSKKQSSKTASLLGSKNFNDPSIRSLYCIDNVKLLKEIFSKTIMYIGRTKIFKDFQYCYPFSSKTATLLNGKDVNGPFFKGEFLRAPIFRD